MAGIVEHRVRFRTTGRGLFHCYRCGGDRDYRQLSGRRWTTVCRIPLRPADSVGSHVQCTGCGTCYRMGVLALPTVAQMQSALPVGVQAAATAMLHAAGGGGEPARRRAIEAIQGAGLADYDDAALDGDLARYAGSGRLSPELAGRLRSLAMQLEVPARDWFLAETVRIGLADGELTDDERNAALQIAAQLGMTQDQARGVIAMTERSAAAG